MLHVKHLYSCTLFSAHACFVYVLYWLVGEWGRTAIGHLLPADSSDGGTILFSCRNCQVVKILSFIGIVIRIACCRISRYHVLFMTRSVQKV